MDYEKLYKESLEKARVWQNHLYKTNDSYYANELNDIFPELKEDEDERIRKALIENFSNIAVISEWGSVEELRISDIITWLEKQGNKDKLIQELSEYKVKYTQEVLSQQLEKQSEHKPINEVTPKFKVGDWITDGEYTWKIIDIRQLDYILQSQDGKVVDDTISYVDEHFHLWTIKDARDGEILVDAIDGRPFIFKDFSDSSYPNSPVAYCGINSECDFRVSYGSYRWTDKDVKPATKEQCDLLFQKMREAGYMWDGHTKMLICSTDIKSK